MARPPLLLDIRVSTLPDQHIAIDCRLPEHEQSARRVIPTDALPEPSLSDLDPKGNDLPEQLRHAGTRLFNALFEGDTLRLYAQLWGKSREDPERRLHLRLRIDPDDERAGHFHGLPWEALYDPRLHAHLVFDRRVFISRGFALLGPGRAWEPRQPLHILALASTDSPLLPALSLDAELDVLRRALMGTDAQLDEQLRVPGDAWHAVLAGDRHDVLHFLGHGVADALPTASSDGTAMAFPHRDFGNLLRGLDRLQVVVINACEGADARYPTTHRQLLGLAHRLIEAGVPAVVAMHGKFSDTAALRFTRAFYRGLVRGDPIELAVAGARREMLGGDLSPLSWLQPLLFLRQVTSATAPDSDKPTPRGDTARVDTVLRRSRAERLNITGNELGEDSPDSRAETHTDVRVGIHDSDIGDVTITGTRRK